MFIPKHFKTTDYKSQIDFIEDNPLGIVVSQTENRPFVSHIPFYHESDGDKEILYGHLAKANPHWQILAKQQQSVVVFQGANAYISPTWYEIEDVPTWNYAAVHVHGDMSLITNTDAVMTLLDTLTARQERKNHSHWAPNWQDKSLTNMLRGIVGIKLEITEIEGKFKLSQNRSLTDRRNVTEHLTTSNQPQNQATANLMRATLANIPDALDEF